MARWTSVQQVFRQGVNTFKRNNCLFFNGLNFIDPRCSGVYPVLAIEHQDRLPQEGKAPHTSVKKTGLSHFQYIGKHLNTSMSCIAKKSIIRAVLLLDRCLPST
jgi:hypothetical protein